MQKEMLLWPVFAQVFLIIIVWCWMYYTRLKEIFTRKIPAQDLANTIEAKKILQKVAGPSDNLTNLFEIPILFFIAMLIIYMKELVHYHYFILGSSYVTLRYIHSLIHSTYNNVMQRFTVYFISTIILWIMWILLAVDILLK